MVSPCTPLEPDTAKSDMCLMMHPNNKLGHDGCMQPSSPPIQNFNSLNLTQKGLGRLKNTGQMIIISHGYHG